MIEEWRSVVGSENLYEVSNHGRVRSLPRKVRHGGRSSADALIMKGGKLLKPTDRRGYLVVNISHRVMLVHRLVLEAFSGKCPEGMEGCHNNGISTDNRLSNLRWDTRMSNHADKKLHGTDCRGERSWNARLTAECISRIADMNACGVYQKDIARYFGITQPHVSAILSGKRWPDRSASR